MSNFDLYYLIKSLTKSEKRYIRLKAFGEKKPNNYEVLFNELTYQTEYKKTQIVSRYSDSNFVKHLSPTKSKLYSLILRHLRSFNTGKGIERQIQEYFGDILILQEKGLYSQAKKKIEAIKKLAFDANRFLHLLNALSIETQILAKEGYSPSSKSMIDVIEQEFAILKLYKSDLIYKDLLNQYYTLYRKGENVKMIQLLDENKYLINYNLAKGTHAKIIFYMLLLFKQHHNNDLINIHTTVQNLKDILFSSIPYAKYNSRIIIVALHNCMTVLFRLNLLESVDNIISSGTRFFTENAILTTRDDEVQYFEFIELSYLTLLIKKKEADLDYIEKFEKKLILYRNSLSHDNYMIILYNLAIFCFVSNDKRKALKYSNLLMNLDQYKIEQLAIDNLVFNIIVLFDLAKDSELIVKKIEELENKINACSNSYTIELNFIQELKKILKNEQDISEKSLFVEFQKKFDKYKKEEDLSDVFDYNDWIESKALERTTN